MILMFAPALLAAGCANADGQDRTKSVSVKASSACVKANKFDNALDEVVGRVGRERAGCREEIGPEVRNAIRDACAGQHGAAPRIRVICGWGHPGNYCDAYDEEAEPSASVSASDARGALTGAGLTPIVVRPTTESFATIVAADSAEARRVADVADYDDYSEQASGTATGAFCNIVFVPFVGAKDNSHAAEMRKQLERRCDESGKVDVAFVATTTTKLTSQGSPNCCDPEYPRPQSLSGAVVIGAGGLPKQAEVGVAHVVVFPDQVATREYLAWYERESADGGDAGYMKDPILRACNAVIDTGGGVYSPEDQASMKTIRRIAEALLDDCEKADGRSYAVEAVGGEQPS